MQVDMSKLPEGYAPSVVASLEKETHDQLVSNWRQGARLAIESITYATTNGPECPRTVTREYFDNTDAYSAWRDQATKWVRETQGDFAVSAKVFDWVDGTARLRCTVTITAYGSQINHHRDQKSMLGRFVIQDQCTKQYWNDLLDVWVPSVEEAGLFVDGFDAHTEAGLILKDDMSRQLTILQVLQVK